MSDEPCDVGPAEERLVIRVGGGRVTLTPRGVLIEELDDVSLEGAAWFVRREEMGAGDAMVTLARYPNTPKRHHPAGIAPVAERDERARRRVAEQNLMDFYTDPRDYRAALDAMKAPEPVPHVEAGETFARLIRRG